MKSFKKKSDRTTEPAARAVFRETQQSFREHSKWFSRMKFLLQEEYEQLGRLTSEMEDQLAETIDLLKKYPYDAS